MNDNLTRISTTNWYVVAEYQYPRTRGYSSRVPKYPTTSILVPGYPGYIRCTRVSFGYFNTVTLIPYHVCMIPIFYLTYPGTVDYSTKYPGKYILMKVPGTRILV